MYVEVRPINVPPGATKNPANSAEFVQKTKVPTIADLFPLCSFGLQ